MLRTITALAAAITHPDFVAAPSTFAPNSLSQNMKSRLLFFTLLLTLHPLSAQTCDEMLRAAQTAEQRGAYFDAYKKYDAALTRCGDTRKEEIERKKQGAVAQLERQRERAEQAEAKGKKEQEKTAAALAKADSALQKANKLVNAFYFYGGRFALAYGERSGDTVFYFINKNGDEVYKLGRWEKAEQFDERGFAKVKKKEGHELIDYLLDTFGNIYRVAYDLNNLGAGVVALDLSGKKLRNYLQTESDVWTHKELNLLLLDGNGLNALPPEIGQLKNLTYLDLSNNELKSLPSEIEQLKNLKTLCLSRNQLIAMPPEIGQLKNLTALDVKWNQLAALPPEIGQLESLVELDLSSTQLTVLPPEIGQLKNLKRLGLYCPLSILPPEIWQLKNLTEFILSGTQLAVLSPEIGQLKNMITLDLRNNQLNALPPEIGQLKNLKNLFLTNNDLVVSSLAQIRSMLPNCRIDFDYMITAISLFSSNRYQDAYEMQKVAVLEDDKNPLAWSFLSEYALYARQPQEAIAAAKKALALNLSTRTLESYLALGYLLNNQWPEAEERYLKMAQYDKLWIDVFLSDIATLEAAGITHPDFAKVKAMLQK